MPPTADKSFDDPDARAIQALSRREICSEATCGKSSRADMHETYATPRPNLAYSGEDGSILDRADL